MEIWKHKFGWIGHTLRKNDAEPSKAALQWKVKKTEEQLAKIYAE
jgi:hypothetical protein